MSATKPVVLIPGRIHPRVVARLEGACTLLTVPVGELPALSQADAATVKAIAVSGDVSAAWMECLPALEIIANFGVGYDGVDVAAAAKRGIVVTNTPDVLSDEVADATIGLLLNTVREFYFAEKYLRDGRWASEGSYRLTPLSLRGRHVGLYGMGRIGTEIASRLEAFKVKISYHTRSVRPELAYAYHPTLQSLAEAVDTLICIVPKTPETFKVIDATVLKALGSNGVMINVGRGWSVDEDALEAALRDGTIAAAGLDVFQDEPHVPKGLMELSNISLLPHVASASVPTRNGMADMVVDNILGWFRDGSVITPVPETPVPSR